MNSVGCIEADVGRGQENATCRKKLLTGDGVIDQGPLVVGCSDLLYINQAQATPPMGCFQSVTGHGKNTEHLESSSFYHQRWFQDSPSALPKFLRIAQQSMALPSTSLPSPLKKG